MKQDVTVPEIGDAGPITVAEIQVAVGDRLQADDIVVLLESDKATLDVPTPIAGTVTAIHVALGDSLATGDPLLTLKLTDTDTMPAPTQTAATQRAQLVVLGGGPGGYTAAFRAADLGLDVTLIERRDTLGGVCLNVGCIPSKALLHVAKVIEEATGLAEAGVTFGEPQFDLDGIRAFRDRTVSQLTRGLAGLARRRKVRVLTGTGRFTGPNEIEVSGAAGTTRLGFDQAIVACGSEPVRPALLPDDPRVIDSTGALALQDVPDRLLVLGGGIIGLEMAQVYHALGSRIVIAEMMDRILPGADADITAPLLSRISAQYEEIRLATRVTAVTPGEDGLAVTFESDRGGCTESFDRVLVATGRRPNGAAIGAAAAGIAVDDRGFIPVDGQMRSAQPHIFAVGDVVGQPMLAHKATHQGKVAAEVAAGLKSAFEPLAIPSVAYTNPEIAWAGLTETEASARGIAVGKGVFPWAASGRAATLGGEAGLTKILFDPQSRRVLGGAVAGPGAGELLAEIVLAIEMGAVAEDLALTIHPHPTLSETLGFAAEAFEGTLTDL